MRFRFHTLLALVAALAAVSAPAAAQAQDSTQIGPAEIRQQRLKRERALRAAQQWAERHPERYNQLVPPGSDLSPGSVPFEYRLRGGDLATTQVSSIFESVLSLGYTEVKAGDPVNLKRLYGTVHAMLPPEFVVGLPTPAQVETLPPRRLRQAVLGLGGRLVPNLE